jgi:hypothetical protein
MTTQKAMKEIAQRDAARICEFHENEQEYN